MLCPKCGTEVGEKTALCPKCAEKEHSPAAQIAKGRVAVGKITPKKVARGVPTESRSQGDESSARQESVGLEQPSAEMLSLVGQPERSRTAFGVFFCVVLVLVLVVWAFAWMMLTDQVPGSFGRLYRPFQESSREARDFSHIRIRPSGQVTEEQEKAIGLLSVNLQKVFLYTATAHWKRERGILEIRFYEDSGDPQKRSDSTLQVFLAFRKGTDRCSLANLQSYRVIFPCVGVSCDLKKTYSRQLTPLGEISQLAGKLRLGKTVSGRLRDSRSTTVQGKVAAVTWDLRFKAVVRE